MITKAAIGYKFLRDTITPQKILTRVRFDCFQHNFLNIAGARAVKDIFFYSYIVYISYIVYLAEINVIKLIT